MSLSHFFLESQVLAEEAKDRFLLDLAENDIHHARVLRLVPGEHIAVIDAAQDYFECEIVSFENNELAVRISQRLAQGRRLPQLTLVQGIAKGEKMDSIIRQATELGVGRIVPFESERSVVKLTGSKAQAKLSRWSAIARSAAMQSGQTRIPEVYEPKKLPELTCFLRQAVAVVVFWEEAAGGSLRDFILRSSALIDEVGGLGEFVIVVGPEGGLTAAEVDSMLAANENSAALSLGPSILRTETAGVVASALCLYEWGALG